MGAIKGAIISINPSASIVDITHEIPKHDIRAAAFTLAKAAETFPKSSIFVVVVDPGVGTKRRCVLLRTRNGMFFIGPDNGVFTLVAERFGVAEAYEISNKSLMRPQISATFHGRDIMAPIAAHLSLGLRPSEVGPKIKNFKRLRIPKPKLVKGEVFGHIMNVDNFGNIVTNIGANLMRFVEFGELLRVSTKGKSIEAKFVKTFGDVSTGENLCYIGSAGSLEIARNREDLASSLGVKSGDEVRVRRCVKRRKR